MSVIQTIGGGFGLGGIRNGWDDVFPEDSAIDEGPYSPLLSVRGLGGLGGGPSRRSLFDSLFSPEGPARIEDPAFSRRLRELAPPVSGQEVEILFAEGPEAPVPSARLVTRIPHVSLDAVFPLVTRDIQDWPAWLPMIAALEVHSENGEEGDGTIHHLAMTMEGVLAKMVGMGTIRIVSHMRERTNSEGIVQSRWDLPSQSTENDLAANRGSWTLVPDPQGVVVVYEGHQVPHFVVKLGRIFQRAVVKAITKHVRSQLPTMISSLASRAIDPQWTKRSGKRPLDLRFVLQDV